MNRCLAPALLGLALAMPVAAQTLVREAPRDVTPARMAVTTPPDITLDGTAARLSPGSRIRDVRNMLVLSGSLAGQTVPVVYRKDGLGLVHEVWILTEAEYAKVDGLSTATAELSAQLTARLNAIFGAR